MNTESQVNQTTAKNTEELTIFIERHRAGNAFCESVDRVHSHAERQLYPYAWRTRPLPARSKDHHDVDYLRLLL